MSDLIDQLGLTQDTDSISYGQNHEDVRLWRVFGDIQNGCYVEVGGWDPVVHSISRSFYLRGWSGIVVEPVAEAAERYRRVRPRDHVVSCLAGATDGIVDFHVVPDTGLSTLTAGIGARHGSTGLAISTRPTPMRRISDIIDDFAPQEIHFMTIDVEGAEAEVIAGADWSRHRPWVLVVEATVPAKEQLADTGWEAELLAAGYQYAAFDGLNRYYVSGEHSQLGQRLAGCPNVFDRYRPAEWALTEAARQAAEVESERIKIAANDQWLVAMEREQTLQAVLTEVRAALERSRHEAEHFRAALEHAQQAASARVVEQEPRVVYQEVQDDQESQETDQKSQDPGQGSQEVQEGGKDAGPCDRCADVAAKMASLEADKALLHQLLNSRSWRITAPLRRNR